MNTSLPSWLLPIGCLAILFAIAGCFTGPLLGLTQSAGTGWGFLCGAVAGGLFALVVRPGSVKK